VVAVVTKVSHVVRVVHHWLTAAAAASLPALTSASTLSALHAR